MKDARADYKDFPLTDATGTLFAWIGGKLVFGTGKGDKLALVQAAIAQGDKHVGGAWNGQWRSDVFLIPCSAVLKALEPEGLSKADFDKVMTMMKANRGMTYNEACATLRTCNRKDGAA